MKKQLLQDREILINHLQEKIEDLKRKRKQLLNSPNHNMINNELTQHVNVEFYLKQQGIAIPKNNAAEIKVKKQNYIEKPQPIKSKAEILRERKATKQKLEVLKDAYEKKRQLQSIGIYENNPNKIKNMYANGATRKSIDKKVSMSKKQREAKLEKDKIIEEQMQRVQKFLEESKQTTKKSQKVPEQHYSQLISDKNSLKQYEGLIFKKHLNLVDKQNLLEYTFSLLKDPMNQINKLALKAFLLSNPEFCIVFNITKNEIMRDLQVHQSKNAGVFTYQQFYELIKSIEITNKALYPNLNFKINDKDPKVELKQQGKKQKNKQLQNQKQMQKYLQNLFVYFDKKSQKVIERQRFEIALKKALLFDNKKYKGISKDQITSFAQKLSKRRESTDKRDYYKSLEMKYIGLQEIISEYKKYQSCSYKPQEPALDQNNKIDQPQIYSQSQLNQRQQNLPDNEYVPQPLPNQILQQQDFEKYGWNQNEEHPQQFAQLKQMDRYYGQISNKFGNQISWNGFERYRQDFTKFNQCIKQMNQNSNLQDLK